MAQVNTLELLYENVNANLKVLEMIAAASYPTLEYDEIAELQEYVDQVNALIEDVHIYFYEDGGMFEGKPSEIMSSNGFSIMADQDGVQLFDVILDLW